MLAPLPRVSSPPHATGAAVASSLASVPLAVPELAAAALAVPAIRRARVEQLLCFVRMLVVGFWANVLDFALLAVCFRWLHIDAMPSRCIALVLSGVLTFVGSRNFAFRAKDQSVPKQAGRFLVAEVLGVGLNLASFKMCTSLAPFTAPELVSFAANALVFIGFSYPVRRLLVFTTPSRPAL
jgi:putative flippase GtrA